MKSDDGQTYWPSKVLKLSSITSNCRLIDKDDSNDKIWGTWVRPMAPSRFVDNWRDSTFNNRLTGITIDLCSKLLHLSGLLRNIFSFQFILRFKNEEPLWFNYGGLFDGLPNGPHRCSGIGTIHAEAQQVPKKQSVPLESWWQARGRISTSRTSWTRLLRDSFIALYRRGKFYHGWFYSHRFWLLDGYSKHYNQ